MKSKLILVSAVTTVLLLLAACSSAVTEEEEVLPVAEEEEVVVTEGPIPREEVYVDVSYDGKEVEVAIGTALTVTLESNATTGFKWELTEVTNQPTETAPREEAEESEPEPEQEGPEPTKPVVVTTGLPEKIVLKHVDNRYVPPEDENIVGGAGKEEWTFHADEEGTSKIYMEYRRSWEEGVEPAKTFTLTVVVK